MSVEVIDLCSSPEFPPPPKTTASTAVAPTQSKPKPRPLPPARALDYDDDVLDSTNVDDNEFSFLPAPRAKPPPELSSPKASRRDDFLFLSDDFDATVDLLINDGPDPFDQHRPFKKLRTAGGISTSARGLNNRSIQRSTSAAEKASVGGPAVLQTTACLKTWTTACDPIQTTSSPLAPVSSNKRNSISSDPFASSPRQAEEIFDLSRDDVDPFASSPRAKGKQNMVAITRKRAASPGIPGSSPQRPRSKAPAPPRVSVGWDHISSSAPEPSARDDDGWDLDLPHSRGGLTRSRSGGLDLGDLADIPGSSDDEEFPDIDSITKPVRSSSHKAASKTVTAPRASLSKSSTSNPTKMTAEERAAVREAEKQRKQREKDEAKEQRRQEKERAAALAEVNKVRTNKNISTPEMIVDLPSSMNPSIRLQVENLLEDLSVKHYPYTSPVNNVVKWRRKVRAVFNEDAGYWEPIQQERIEPENQAMVLMTAPEFVELALGAKGSDLEAHVLRVQQHYEGHAVIYLIEGLTPWMRKNRNMRNRQFQTAVRNAGVDAANGTAAAGATAATSDPATAPPPPSSSQAPPGRRKRDPKPPPRYIDEDAVEDALLQLQVAHGAKVHHTAAAVETAQWVSIFTQHISTAPYRRRRDAAGESAAFCMEAGQVRTGGSPADTYARMLQEVARVTAPVAYGVAAEFPTVGALVRGLEEGGPLALGAIRKSANKDGAFTDRCIGQALSRRIYKVFLGRDEASTDI